MCLYLLHSLSLASLSFALSLSLSSLSLVFFFCVSKVNNFFCVRFYKTSKMHKNIKLTNFK